MREIKFRAWHEGHQTMVNFDNAKVKKDQYQASYLAALMDGEYGDVLMQFTGLTDKNGAEVFEGDIIQNKLGRVCKVVWFNSAGCWDSDYLYDTDADSKHELSDGFAPNRWWANVEVIGNIHSNPELLT